MDGVVLGHDRAARCALANGHNEAPVNRATACVAIRATSRQREVAKRPVTSEMCLFRPVCNGARDQMRTIHFRKKAFGVQTHCY